MSSYFMDSSGLDVDLDALQITGGIIWEMEGGGVVVRGWHIIQTHQPKSKTWEGIDRHFFPSGIRY